MSQAACKLLIADDEPWVRENLVGLVDWKELSIELAEPAEDGEDALRKVESGKPDILITDIDMPHMDGNELIRRVKKSHPGLQVIVLSGYGDFAYVRDALLHGALDYLLKPVTRGALADVLEKALGALSSERETEREAADSRARLLEATSILRDGEMSLAISEEDFELGAERARGGAILDLDLEFASFTLVVAKLTSRGDGRSSSAEISRRGREIKAILSAIARGSKQVAFHNLFARNEFVLLIEIDPSGLARLLGELPDRLEKRTGLRASVAASRSYYSFDKLRSAYLEARASLMGRSLGGGRAARADPDAFEPEVRRRVTPELERRLEFALGSRNKRLARDLIFEEIGLRGCVKAGWLLIEAKQTAEYVAAMIYHRADPGPASSPSSMLAMDNLAENLGMALDGEDIPEACSVLEQLLDEAFGESVDSGASDGMIGVARRARDYVDEHYFEDISLTSVAAFLHTDRAFLSKAFKQVTGCNIMLSIAKRRIERAQEYIRQGDQSLTDIADLVGYEEYAYFNRVFRKVAGSSPSQYKASFQGGGR